MDGASAPGSAVSQGALWGARAKDWAEVQESMARPLFEAVLREPGIGAGMTVLDVGCGAGLFCELAARRGARVAGLDAASGMIAIAQSRVPAGDFRTGEMEHLPYEDGTFDVVTGFNSFQFAANAVNALKEAKRVARSRAAVVIATWGKPEDCETAAYLAAMRPLLPPAPPGAPGPFALSADGALEALVAQAELTPQGGGDVDCPFEYPNLETALKGLLAAGPAIRAIETSGELKVRDAVIGALTPFKTATGEYRMENKFRYLITRA
jgi:SAM-dependent methyltransferase